MFFNLVSQELHFVLRFLSGEREGSAFEMPRDREVVIGRAEGVDITLADTRVSRKHVRVNVAGHQLMIIDLGSRNGTFVNGERVLRARLKEGDQLRVGSCVLRVELAGNGQDNGKPTPDRSHSDQPAIRGESGQLEETPLLELLRRWMNVRRNGVVVLHSAAGTARLHLQEGQVGNAEMDGRPTYSPRKVLFRLLGWSSGTYRVESPVPGHAELELSRSPTDLLEDAVQYLEDLDRLRDQLPAADASMLVPSPPPAEIKDLSRSETEVYELVLKHGTLQSVMDHYAGTDLEAARHFASLLRQGFIVVV